MLKLDQLCSVELDAGAHGGSGDTATNILTLCSSGLSLDDSADQSVVVLGQLGDDGLLFR